MRHIRGAMILGLGFWCTLAGAAGPVTPTPVTPTAEDAANAADKVNVDALKQRYWERGEDTDIRVVQNRLYPKVYKFELSPQFAAVAGDPFLSVFSVGGQLGFHVSEYIAIQVMGAYYLAGDSSALTALRSQTGREANTNIPKWFVGGGVQFSPIYGKVSVLGKAIFHYDLYLNAGAGITRNETGSYLTPYVGIGQVFYITKWLGLRFDYRFTIDYEARIKKDDGSNAILPSAWNWAHVFGVGLSFSTRFF